ncbi:MAG: hypothetical protein ABL952_04130 [Pyrinomonadaceae bacterium]
MNTHLTRTLLKTAVAVGSLLILFTIPHFGQRAASQDGLMDSGYMTSGDISDDFAGTDDEYFYKFMAKPGQLTITFEVAGTKTNAGAKLDLIGAGSKPILSNMTAEAVKGGSEQAFTTVTITKKQDVIIRIKGISYGNGAGNPGTYKIVIEGSAANFMGGEPSGGPAEGEVMDDTPAKEKGQETGKGKKPSKVDGAIDKAKKESSKWLELVDKVKKKP